MTEQTSPVDALINQAIESDAEFQTSLEAMSEEEKTAAIEAKRLEVLKTESPKWLEKASKAEEIAENQRKRAEKAEGLNKGKKEDVEPANSNLSTIDTIALIEAKVPTADINEVVEYAKFKKITVAEALQSSVVKNVLAEKAEVRKTAAATTTRATRPTAKMDGASILANAKAKGEEGLPEKGSSAAEDMFWARRGRPNPNQK